MTTYASALISRFPRSPSSSPQKLLAIESGEPLFSVDCEDPDFYYHFHYVEDDEEDCHNDESDLFLACFNEQPMSPSY
jgi:hypothetical protein